MTTPKGLQYEPRPCPVAGLNGPCHISKARPSSSGYVQLCKRFIRDGKPQRTQKLAHRVAWELSRGPIPGGLLIDHRCRVKQCINPDHLRVVTHQVNITENGGMAEKQVARTTCPRGHAYTPENTFYTITPTGKKRECLKCKREYARKYSKQRRDRAKKARSQH